MPVGLSEVVKDGEGVSRLLSRKWIGENHLRHSKFVGLREDKKAKDVHRE